MSIGVTEGGRRKHHGDVLTSPDRYRKAYCCRQKSSRLAKTEWVLGGLPVVSWKGASPRNGRDCPGHLPGNCSHLSELNPSSPGVSLKYGKSLSNYQKHTKTVSS